MIPSLWIPVWSQSDKLAILLLLLPVRRGAAARWQISTPVWCWTWKMFLHGVNLRCQSEATAPRSTWYAEDVYLNCIWALRSRKIWFDTWQLIPNVEIKKNDVWVEDCRLISTHTHTHTHTQTQTEIWLKIRNIMEHTLVQLTATWILTPGVLSER